MSEPSSKKKAGRPRLYDGVKCIYPECDAPAIAHRLCRIHYTVWPYHMFLHGDRITERRVTRDGYVEARVDGVWALEHRLVLTRELGRFLDHKEIVQWKDGNCQNNRIENLELLTRDEIARRKQAARESESLSGKNPRSKEEPGTS